METTRSLADKIIASYIFRVMLYMTDQQRPHQSFEFYPFNNNRRMKRSFLNGSNIKYFALLSMPKLSRV